jgi:hypothetical protein
MNKAKGKAKGMMAAFLILAGGSIAPVAPAGSTSQEWSFGGMAVLTRAQGTNGLYGRASLGFFGRTTGWQADIFLADPESSFIEGSFVFNPFCGAALSPTLRLGGTASLGGAMTLDLAAGLRWRMIEKLGVRAEYHLWNPFAVRETAALSLGCVFGF